jgi:hypothetical protein
MKQTHHTSDVCGAQSSSAARQLKRRIAYSTPGLSRLNSCRKNPLAQTGARRQCTCTRNLGLVVVTAKMNMQVMVKLSVAASSGKLDLSDCNLTEVPPEVCNIKGLEVSISCLPPWSQFAPVVLDINTAPRGSRCHAFSQL